MDYPQNKSRYLLLPNLDEDGECEMIDVCHIQAIDKIEAEDYETVDEDTGDVITGHNEEQCLVTISPLSTFNKNWKDKARYIKVPLTMFQLLSLINSDAEFRVNSKDI